MSYLGINGSSSDAVSENALKAVKLAIKTPSILLVGDLLALDAVKQLKPSPSLELVKILNQGTITEYNALISKNPNLLKDLGLNSEEIGRKVRILTLANLACKHVGKVLQYDTIAKTLEIPVDKVEFWIIDGN